MDFIVNRLATAGADTSLGSGCLTRALEQLIEERERLEALRSDNGPEFCSRRMPGWAEERKIELVHYPARPSHAEPLRGILHLFGRLREDVGGSCPKLELDALLFPRWVVEWFIE